MVPQELIDQLPPWALYIFFALVALGAAFNFVRNLKFGAKQGSETQAASRAITAVSSVQPAAAGMTNDELVRTFAALAAAVDRLTARLDEQDREQDAEDRAAELLLRQQMRELMQSGRITLAPREPP